MSFAESDLDDSLRSRAFEWILFLLAGGLLVLLVFAPLIFVSGYASELHAMEHATAEAAVGTGVLLRVALRRVFRTAARSLLQTTMGTFSRASARTVTRRVVRLAVKSAAVTVKNQYRSEEALPEQQWSMPWHVALSLATLACSFYGVIWVAGPAKTQSLTQSHSTIVLALLAAAPMLAFAILVRLASRWHGVEARFQTSWDGVFLQAYFTGAGSFLPLATDVEYFGERQAQSRTAVSVLGGLLALHWLLHGLGVAMGNWQIEFFGEMTLIYGFVYSFPLKPLDGYYLWRGSKWQWALMWLALLISFLKNVTDAIQGVL